MNKHNKPIKNNTRSRRIKKTLDCNVFCKFWCPKRLICKPNRQSIHWINHLDCLFFLHVTALVWKTRTIYLLCYYYESPVPCFFRINHRPAHVTHSLSRTHLMQNMYTTVLLHHPMIEIPWALISYNTVKEWPAHPAAIVFFMHRIWTKVIIFGFSLTDWIDPNVL